MKKVNLCNSGGRTSAYMTEKLLELQTQGYFPDIDFVITFANTGREHEKTLEFVNNCANRWYDLYSARVIWVEANVLHGLRMPTIHKIVDFKTASRNGEPFEEVTKKYGLPNGTFLHCTRELKENPIISLMEMYGGKVGHTKDKVFMSATYETWIGIREDEPRRLGGKIDGKQYKRYPLAHPLESSCGRAVDLSCDKQDVLDFWEEMPFDLDLPEHQGNCVDCHKKSNKKLAKIFNETPEVFEFTEQLDNKYSEVKAQVLDGKLIKRKRFRGYKDTGELIASFDLAEHNPKDYDEESGGCSESCEAFVN